MRMTRRDAFRCTGLAVFILPLIAATNELTNPCGHGLYGNNCQQHCNCRDSSERCDSNGHCLSGCQAGYTGAGCSKACELGYYGLNCEKLCKCTNDCPCHPVTGTCDTDHCLGFAQVLSGSSSANLSIILPITFFVILLLAGIAGLCVCCTRLDRGQDIRRRVRRSLTHSAGWVSSNARHTWRRLSSTTVRGASKDPPKHAASGGDPSQGQKEIDGGEPYYNAPRSSEKGSTKTEVHNGTKTPSVYEKFGKLFAPKAPDTDKTRPSPEGQTVLSQIQTLTSSVYEIVERARERFQKFVASKAEGDDTSESRSETGLTSMVYEIVERARETFGKLAAPKTEGADKPKPRPDVEVLISPFTTADENEYEIIVQMDSVSIDTSSTSAVSELPSTEYESISSISPKRVFSPQRANYSDRVSHRWSDYSGRVSQYSSPGSNISPQKSSDLSPQHSILPQMSTCAGPASNHASPGRAASPISEQVKASIESAVVNLLAQAASASINSTDECMHEGVKHRDDRLSGGETLATQLEVSPDGTIYSNFVRSPSPRGQRVWQAVAALEASVEKNAPESALTGRETATAAVPLDSPSRRLSASPRRQLFPRTSPDITTPNVGENHDEQCYEVPSPTMPRQPSASHEINDAEGNIIDDETVSSLKPLPRSAPPAFTTGDTSRKRFNLSPENASSELPETSLKGSTHPDTSIAVDRSVAITADVVPIGATSVERSAPPRHRSKGLVHATTDTVISTDSCVRKGVKEATGKSLTGRSLSSPGVTSTLKSAPTLKEKSPPKLTPKTKGSSSATSPLRKKSSSTLTSAPVEITSPIKPVSHNTQPVTSSVSPEKTLGRSRSASTRDRTVPSDKAGKTRSTSREKQDSTSPPWDASTCLPALPARRADTLPKAAPRKRWTSPNPDLRVSRRRSGAGLGQFDQTSHHTVVKKPPLPFACTPKTGGSGLHTSPVTSTPKPDDPGCDTSPFSTSDSSLALRSSGELDDAKAEMEMPTGETLERKTSSGFLPELGTGHPIT